MKSLAGDIGFAVTAGILLPALLVGAGVKGMELGRESVTIVIEEAVQEQETGEMELPVKVMMETGTEEIGMEMYLTGVMLAEMPTDFPEEALKAQAVAARTYAEKAYETGGKHGDGSICVDSRCCQAYCPTWEYLLKGGTEERLEKVQRAVQETAGMVLAYEGELIEATYYACSGGRSEDAKEVWGTDYPYLVAVDSPGEEAAGHYRSEQRFTADEIKQRLGEQPDAGWIGQTTYTEGGGVKNVELGGTVFSGTELREKLGLYSTAFTIREENGEFVFETKGYGHRVGMSQYGAAAMAESGCGFREILAHYYPGTEISRIKRDS